MYKRPIRKILAENLRYQYYSITQDDKRLCVRILVPVLDFDSNPINCECIFDTEKHVDCFINLNNQMYKIVAAGVFDLNYRVHKYWWTPGSNILFNVTPHLIANKTVEVVQKGAMTMCTKENSAEYGHRVCEQTICQIWCRNTNDKITETAKSIVCPIPNGQIFTNIDLSRADECSADFVNNTEGSSGYLNITTKMFGPASVKPNEVFNVEVRVFADLDQHLAEDVTGNFIVEAVDGYIPHRRVHVQNGIGRFKACALMLQSGETMRIKLGTKTTSSRDEIIISVE